MSTTKTQQRVSFSTVKNRVPYPDLLEVQLKSFRDFFQMDTTAENRKNEGLYKVFQENFPITDTRNNFVLEFIDYYIDPPSMPFLGLKTGSAEQELCPLFGNGCSRGELRLQTGALAG